MKKSIRCLFLLILSIPAFCTGIAPGVTIKWGPELEGSRRGSISRTLGYDDSGYYVQGYEKSDIFIKKVNTSLNFVAEYRFEEKDAATKLRYEFEGVHYYNDKLWLFKSTINKDDKLKELYVQEIDKMKMTASGPLKKITQIAYTKTRDKGFFEIISSHDENNLLIVLGTPTERDENEKFTLLMCDQSLSLLWKKDFTLPYSNKLFVRYGFKCDEHGNAFLMGKLYKDKVKEVRRGEQNFSWHIVSYTSSGENSVDYEIKIDQKFITDISFSVTDDGDIVAGGFYSKIGSYAVDGAYYLMLDSKTKSVKTSSVKEFDIDFITQGMTERQEARAKKKEEKGKDTELYQYDLHDLVKRDDGGLVLIGEQFYITTSTYSDGKTSYTSYHYHYHDIIIINIDNAGKIEWSQKIPKRQVSTNDGGFYSSYSLAVTNDKLRFIFNDNKNNLTLKKQGDWKNYTFGDKDGIVALVTIDKNGGVTREALVKDSELEVIIRPKVSNQINDNEVLLYGEKRKKDQFGVVRFE